MSETNIFILGLLACNIFILGAYDHIRTLLNSQKHTAKLKELNKEDHLYNKGVANFKIKETSNINKYRDVMYR